MASALECTNAEGHRRRNFIRITYSCPPLAGSAIHILHLHPKLSWSQAVGGLRQCDRTIIGDIEKPLAPAELREYIRPFIESTSLE